MARRTAVALLVLLLASCTAGTQPGPADVRWDPMVPGSLPTWRAAAEARFGPDVVLFDTHGGYRPDGTWVAVPKVGRSVPMADVARALKLLYPDRPVVLLPCNSRGATLGVPGVYYARRKVSMFHGVPSAPTYRIDDFRCDPPPRPRRGV